MAPFDPSDAWLLQAVLYAGGLTEGAELRDVIALGDGLEDALFTAEELRGGFARLTAAGFVRAESGRYFVVGEALRLGESEKQSFRDHREAIAAFLAASDYRGIESEEIDPDLTDERIGRAAAEYLAQFQPEDGDPERDPSAN